MDFFAIINTAAATAFGKQTGGSDKPNDPETIDNGTGTTCAIA